MSGVLVKPVDVEDMLTIIRVHDADNVTVSKRFMVDLCERLIELEVLTAPLRRHVKITDSKDAA